MPRYLGIDYGKRRIGLAVSDVLGTLATPLATLPATGNPADDAVQVAAAADLEHVEAFVVGLPLNMDGSEGPQAKTTREFVRQLEARAGSRPVTAWDERLSSFAADELLNQTHLTAAQRKKRRDQIAAQVILQSYLDSLDLSAD